MLLRCCGCCHPRIQEQPVLRGGVIRVLRLKEVQKQTVQTQTPFATTLESLRLKVCLPYLLKGVI